MDRELYDNLADPAVSASAVSSTQDVETEKALLSVCMRKKEALDTTINRGITKESFSDERNRLIFEAIATLYIDNGTIDRFNIVDVLEHKGYMTRAGGTQYIFSVADAPAVTSNLESYIKIVKEKCSMRMLMAAFDEFKKSGASGESSTNDIIDLCVGRLTAMREAPEGIGFEALQAILKRNLNEIHAIINGKERESTVLTGFRGLDAMLGGLKPGSLNIIAARPGMGKTSLVINIATNVAVHKRHNVDIFSLEMSKAEIGNRILASRADVTSKELARAKISKEKEEELTRAYRTLAELPIYIDDNSAVNPVKMLSKCKELKSRGQLGLVIVDYLQLMSGSGLSKNASRQEEVANISRSLKIMAKDLQVPIIALAQLSRASEKRSSDRADGSGTPLLSDLRDSGAIEQDADTVLFIDRDYYKKGEETPVQDARLIVAKNRHGETGTVHVKWWAAKTMFFEEDRKYDPVDPTTTGAQSSSSAYTRTVSSDASASDYKFEGEPEPPPFDMDPNAVSSYDDDMPMPQAPDEDSEFANPDNDDFFEGSSSDFPEGF